MPDVVWHVPGDNPASGRHQGYDEVFVGEPMQPSTPGQSRSARFMGNDAMVVAVVALVAVRGTHRVACRCRGAHAFRFATDGRIAEVWGFVDDQELLDALLSS